MTADEILALSDDELRERVKALARPMLGYKGKVFFSSVFTYDFAMRLRDKVLGYGKSRIILDNGNVEVNCDNGRIDLWHDGASEKAECRAILQACLFVTEAGNE